tara:strand:- start:106 stop:741 length:636 start_codon:yes stop_codon:yes gene_type:complete
MLPSIKKVILTTIIASFFSIYGLVFNNNVILIAAANIAPTAFSFYYIIRDFILTKNMQIGKFILYFLISIIIPLLMGMFFGYILEVLKTKYTNEDTDNLNIPSTYMKEKITYHHINMIMSIFIPILSCLLLPYSLETNNVCLIIGVSIALSFIVPITTIGLFIGSNKHTDKLYTIKDYIIPIITFTINFICIIIISFIMIKYLGFDKKIKN